MILLKAFAAYFPKRRHLFGSCFILHLPKVCLPPYFFTSGLLLGFSINFTARVRCISIRIFSHINSVHICIAVLFTDVLNIFRGHFELIHVSFFVCLCFFEDLLPAEAIPDTFLRKPPLSDSFLKMLLTVVFWL